MNGVVELDISDLHAVPDEHAIDRVGEEQSDLHVGRVELEAAGGNIEMVNGPSCRAGGRRRSSRSTRQRGSAVGGDERLQRFHLNETVPLSVDSETIPFVRSASDSTATSLCVSMAMAVDRS